MFAQYRWKVRMKKLSVLIVLSIYFVLGLPIALVLGCIRMAEEIDDAINEWIKR